MNNNSFKTLFTFNDEKITIVLFNNVLERTNILFYKSININEKLITNGYISNNELVSKHIKELLDEASEFIGKKILEVYTSVDCNEIVIKPLELHETKLKDGIFDQTVWNQIKEGVEIKQITDKYIYDVKYLSWKIDGNDYFELTNNSIAGEKLVIKAVIYQINKILHQNYERIFEKNNIKMISFLPLVNTFTNLIDNSKNDHYELFIYLNENALVMCQTSGKNLQRCVYEKELGLSHLYDVISNANKIDLATVRKIFKTNLIFSNDHDFKIINGYDNNEFKLQEFNLTNIKEIVDEYVYSISNIINENIKFLRENKNIPIKKITFVPIDRITKNIINLTQMHNESNFLFYHDDSLNEYDDYPVQQTLMIDYISNNYDTKQKNKNNHHYLNDKNKKEIKS